jgi:hypothetical protein
MKKVSFVTDKVYQNNNIFNKSKMKVGNIGKYIELKERFRVYGYEISTDDIFSPDESDLILYFDMPGYKIEPNFKDKSYLLAIESAIVKPNNLAKENIEFLKKVFTWNDDLIDGDKFIKINYSFDFPVNINKNIKRKKLCCLIVSNKSSVLENELYSERLRAIKWFEENHIEDFDLYGYGWDRFDSKGRLLLRGLNKFKHLSKLIFKIFGKKRPSYKGVVTDKIQTMKEYRFSIAYENVKGFNGYITEKIFDSFMSGCVPIYLGADNVLEYIPSNCFIDRRKFSDYESLYKYINEMGDLEYSKYLENIQGYLNSKESKAFTNDLFSKTIVDECTK